VTKVKDKQTEHHRISNHSVPNSVQLGRHPLPLRQVTSGSVQ